MERKWKRKEGRRKGESGTEREGWKGKCKREREREREREKVRGWGKKVEREERQPWREGETTYRVEEKVEEGRKTEEKRVKSCHSFL